MNTDSNAAHNLLDDFRIGRLVEDGSQEASEKT